MIALLRRLLDSKTQHIARLPSKKSQRKEQRPQTKVATWQYIASIAATVLVLCVLLYTVYVYRQRIQLSEGRPSPMHYKAPRDVSVLDPIATERLRQEARNKVRPVYKANPENTKLVEDVVSNGQLPASVKTLVLQRYANTQGVNEVARQSLIEEAVTLEPSRSAEVQTILERDLLATAEEDSTLLQTLRDARPKRSSLATKPCNKTKPSCAKAILSPRNICGCSRKPTFTAPCRAISSIILLKFAPVC